MSIEKTKKILAVVADLFFTVKIHEAAKRTGFTVEFVKSETDALLKAAEQPAMIVLDLNFAGVESAKLIGALKSGAATKAIPLVGYLSHVQAELKREAQRAGCDVVLAKSAFSQHLPQLLKRHA